MQSWEPDPRVPTTHPHQHLVPPCWGEGWATLWPPTPLHAPGLSGKEWQCLLAPAPSSMCPSLLGTSLPSSGSTSGPGRAPWHGHRPASVWEGTAGRAALSPGLTATGLGLHFPTWTLSCKRAPKSGLRSCRGHPMWTRQAAAGHRAPPAATGAGMGHCHPQLPRAQGWQREAAGAAGLACSPGHGAAVSPGRENFEPCVLSWAREPSSSWASRMGQASHGFLLGPWPQSCVQPVQRAAAVLAQPMMPTGGRGLSLHLRVCSTWMPVAPWPRWAAHRHGQPVPGTVSALFPLSAELQGSAGSDRPEKPR